MKDITFTSSKQNELFKGRFFIPLRTWRKGFEPGDFPDGIMIGGLILALASKRKNWSRRNLQTLALTVLLLALILG
jgi:hypothetical protein